MINENIFYHKRDRTTSIDFYFRDHSFTRIAVIITETLVIIAILMQIHSNSQVKRSKPEQCLKVKTHKEELEVSGVTSYAFYYP
jgi:hypothetical protein